MGGSPFRRRDDGIAIAWARWALAQADRIDPVRSGRFVESMRDEELSAATDTEGFEPPVA